MPICIDKRISSGLKYKDTHAPPYAFTYDIRYLINRFKEDNPNLRAERNDVWDTLVPYFPERAEYAFVDFDE